VRRSRDTPSRAAGRSEGLSIPRSSLPFRLNPDSSTVHEFENTVDSQTRVVDYT